MDKVKKKLHCYCNVYATISRNQVSELSRIRSKVYSSIAYWNDVELIDIHQEAFSDKEGEIFFEAKGGYQLVDTKEAKIRDFKK